jgi:hypothetical protein
LRRRCIVQEDERSGEEYEGKKDDGERKKGIKKKKSPISNKVSVISVI